MGTDRPASSGQVFSPRCATSSTPRTEACCTSANGFPIRPSRSHLHILPLPPPAAPRDAAPPARPGVQRPPHDVLDASPGGGGPRSENRSAAASARWKQKLKDFLNGRPIDPSTCDYVVKFVENEVQKQQEKTEKVVEQHKEKIGELARVKSELTELEEACRRLEEANGVSEERAGRGRTG